MAKSQPAEIVVDVLTPARMRELADRASDLAWEFQLFKPELAALMRQCRDVLRKGARNG